MAHGGLHEYTKATNVTVRQLGLLPARGAAQPDFLERAMSYLQYPLWQKPVREAIEEPDLQKLSEKLYAAESAIFQRAQELSVSPDDEESEAIRLACKEILKIQTQRLKWPVHDGILSDRAE